MGEDEGSGHKHCQQGGRGNLVSLPLEFQTPHTFAPVSVSSRKQAPKSAPTLHSVRLLLSHFTFRFVRKMIATSNRTLLASSSSSSSRSLAPRNLQLTSRRARLNAARPNVTPSPISTQEHHKRRARPNAAFAQPPSVSASAQEVHEERQGLSARPRPHLSTFQLLSAELSQTAAIQRFERLAGRSAMVSIRYH